MGEPALEIPNAVDRTATVYRPAGRSGGNCASIRVGEVLKRGRAISLAVTQTPPMFVGSGGSAAATSARLLPRIDTNDPGEIDAVPLAPFIVRLITGTRPAVAVNDTMLS